MKLLPFKTFYKTTNTLYTFSEEGGKYLVKVYSGPNNVERCAREKNTISHWKGAGFNVPEIYDKCIPSIKEPYLVMSCIEGIPLREYLTRNTCPTNEKLQTLEKLFRQMSKRHRLAESNDDRCLIHYDPSSGNIICVDQEFFYVDFETKPKYRTVVEAAGTELLTLCKWIVRDLGIEFVERIIQLVVVSYTDQQPLLKLVVKRTLGRPFQSYHRWKDRKLKKAYPNSVTKYDIAKVIAKLI